MTSETTPMRHLNTLCESIGTRPLGSRGNHEAADYIRRVFSDADLEVRSQTFECPDWRLHEAYLEIGGVKHQVWANRFTQACDLIAPTIALGTLSELENADLEGKIAVLYGEIIRIGFIPKAFQIYNPEINQRLIRIIEEKHPLAIVTVANTTENIQPVIRDWDVLIPSVTVHPETGLALLDQHEPVHLKIESTTAVGHSQNVFGTKSNARRERIVICAHYDTEFDCPGAVDNGVGVAVLLTLAERLSQIQLSTELEFIAFSGEEFAALGEQHYLESHPDFQNMLAVVNVDGVGQKLGNNTLTAMATSTEFEEQLKRLKNEFPQVVWIDPWYESDHTIFAFQGVPSVPMNSLGIRDIYHLPKDQIQWVSAERLDEVINLVTQIVLMLQDKTLEWCRPAK